MKPQALDNKNAETPGPPGRERSNQISEFWVQKGKRKKKGEKKKKDQKLFMCIKLFMWPKWTFGVDPLFGAWFIPAFFCIYYYALYYKTHFN